MIRGFDRLAEILPDLVLDTPNAGKRIDDFIIKAIADGVLPKDYEIKNHAARQAQAQADTIFEQAQRMSLGEEDAPPSN
jgi:hypothetical protein